MWKKRCAGGIQFSNANPQANLFANDYAKAHGIQNGIIDLFYIDGKPASQVFPNLDEVAGLMGEYFQHPTNEGMRDFVARAYLNKKIADRRGNAGA